MKKVIKQFRITSSLNRCNNGKKFCFYSLSHESTPELLEEIAFQNHYEQHAPLKTYENLNNPHRKLYERKSYLESKYVTEKREPKTFTDKLAKGIVTCIKAMIELYFGKSRYFPIIHF